MQALLMYCYPLSDLVGQWYACPGIINFGSYVILLKQYMLWIWQSNLLLSDRFFFILKIKTSLHLVMGDSYFGILYSCVK